MLASASAALAACALLAWFLQFFTPLFEVWHGLGTFWGFVCFALAVSVIALASLELDSRRRAVAAAGGLAIAAASLWVVQAKLAYPAFLAGCPRRTSFPTRI